MKRLLQVLICVMILCCCHNNFKHTKIFIFNNVLKTTTFSSSNNPSIFPYSGKILIDTISKNVVVIFDKDSSANKRFIIKGVGDENAVASFTKLGYKPEGKIYYLEPQDDKSKSCVLFPFTFIKKNDSLFLTMDDFVMFFIYK